MIDMKSRSIDPVGDFVLGTTLGWGLLWAALLGAPLAFWMALWFRRWQSHCALSATHQQGHVIQSG